MLGEKLEDAGCKTIHAREYAYNMMHVVLQVLDAPLLI